MEAVQGALDRLRMLANVSHMADVGASTLTQLLSKASTTTNPATDEVSVSGPDQHDAGDLASFLSFDPSDLNPQDDFSISITMGAMQELQGNWAATPLLDRFQ